MKALRLFLYVALLLLPASLLAQGTNPNPAGNPNLGTNPQSNTTWKDFKSARSYFSFRYPPQWIFYEEAQGNYRFAEAVVTERGVFRILENFHSGDSFNVQRQLEDESKLRPGSTVRLINNYYLLSYTNLIMHEGREQLQYVWVLGSGHVTLHCTYTIRNDMRTDEKIRLEYAQAFQAIENIRFLYH